MGLGLALGIGSEVFGAPGCSPSSGGQEGSLADLSPLSPLLSKSAQRRLRRGSDGGKLPSTVSPADAAPETDSSGGQQHHVPGHKGRPGRTKAERRRRSGGAAGSEEQQEEMAADGSGSLGLGAAPGGSSALAMGDFADWERHSTGIGSRLMLKMGWAGSGAGLGRRQHGRAEPVEAQRRGKRVGLGAE